MRYGIRLTTVEQRQTLAQRRRAQIERFADGESTPPPRSGEQLAAIIAALAGGTPGRFVVNVLNIGQIDNLPRAATVECIAEVDGLGVRPLAVGALPLAAHAAIAPHVARQEQIVEAALGGGRELALAALSSDPLLRDRGRRRAHARRAAGGEWALVSRSAVTVKMMGLRGGYYECTL